MLMTIKGDKKKKKRQLKELQENVSDSACHQLFVKVLKDLADEWVYKKQKKKQNFIIMFRNLD